MTFFSFSLYTYISSQTPNAKRTFFQAAHKYVSMSSFSLYYSVRAPPVYSLSFPPVLPSILPLDSTAKSGRQMSPPFTRRIAVAPRFQQREERTVQHVRHLTGPKHKVKAPVSCRTCCTLSHPLSFIEDQKFRFSFQLGSRELVNRNKYQLGAAKWVAKQQICFGSILSPLLPPHSCFTPKIVMGQKRSSDIGTSSRKN